MTFRIRRGFTIDRPRNRNRYPIKRLKVGEGFIIPKDRVPRGTLHGLGKRYGMQLSTKKQKDGSLQVVRVA